MAQYKTFGTSGLRHYGGFIFEEFLPELKWPAAGPIYQEMADNDPVVGAILFLAEMLIRGTLWEVRAASTSAVDEEAAQFVDECMHDMEDSWDSVISEILSMLTYGFSFHEIIYKVRRGPDEAGRFNSKFSDGKIGWRKIPIRSQATLYRWEFDESNNVSGFEQQDYATGTFVTIPMKKGLLFRTRVSRDNPEGKSMLRNAYRPWYFKKHFEEVEGIGIERDLAGFPVLTAPEDMDLWNQDDENMVRIKGQAEELVSSIRRDSEEGLVLPFGWDLKLLASGSSRQINIGDTIARYDNHIAITMLADIVLMGQKAGSYALADVKQSMLGAALQSILLNISDVFNKHAVPLLMKYNGYTAKITEYPQIMPRKIQSPSLREVALILRSMGLNIAGDKELQNHLRYLLDIPEVSEETFNDVYNPQSTVEQQKHAEAQADKAAQAAQASAVKPGAAGETDVGDTTSNDLEQSDMAYTGGN